MAGSDSAMDAEPNPLNPSESLKPGSDQSQAHANPQQEPLPGDSATTKAEKVERHGQITDDDVGQESPNKRVKLDHSSDSANGSQPERQKGVAPIKKEYLIQISNGGQSSAVDFDDDAAENSGKPSNKEPAAGRGGVKTKGGQNHARSFGVSRDEIQLCRSRAESDEFSPEPCSFGEKCKLEHDLRKYLTKGKREDLKDIFNGVCPVWEERGKCPVGWKCRFASSHSKEVEREDGRKELVLVYKEGMEPRAGNNAQEEDDAEGAAGVVNIVNYKDKIQLRKKKRPTPKSDKMIKWFDAEHQREFGNEKKGGAKANGDEQDHRAEYVEPPLRPSEKRRVYYGPETPVLAPLTTQGNLPFRRLCVSLGAQITWSEMAMSLPLLQGERQEWALMKAHESEFMPPSHFPKNIVTDYNNSTDVRFGAQIAANKPWLAMKTTEVLSELCPNLRAIDLNSGCPIDLVCRQGAGSALLDAPGRMEKLLRGMNTVSGPIPITVKIRMGTKDKQPTAEKLCQRLVLGGYDSASINSRGPAGVAAITLHGRSQQQRYTKSANWSYIAECASLVSKLRTSHDEVTDTVREPDARDLPASGLPYFCGNGDILSHIDYDTHLRESGVDAIMIGRGALVKPWIFEEIESNQYLDKSSSERLAYVERFVRNGLEYWGSDEIGVGTTRRFLLEWLSFSCRYVPIGLLEYLPPKFGDRPPAFRGRDELETLLSSGNYKDWIRISEMFLGKAHKDFRFTPKHKSNSYEIEAEG